jgi:hypothetical protein
MIFMKLRRNWLSRLALAGVFTLASLTSPAFGQRRAEEPRPPYDVTGLSHHKMWVPWVFAFLFAAGCLALAFKNPHRVTTERT